MNKTQLSKTQTFDDVNSPKDFIFQKHLINATDGLENFFKNNILTLTKSNAKLIIDFINSSLNYENITVNTKRNKVVALLRFMKFLITKHGKEISFKSVKPDDFIDFQNTIRKSEKQNPLHKWVGTWNQYLRNLKTFYRWINSPDLAPKQRKNPSCMEGINQLHRKEVTTYKPSDMWTEEEDAVFLKYCEDPRIRCYHMMARDTSARPHELLVKRIGDFKEMIAPNGVKYLLTSVEWR